MEEQVILDEMSGGHSGSDQETDTADDHRVRLPAYLAYLSLGFKVIFTAMIVLMAGWVIVTIKTTRRLHTIHNIFIAHLMAADIISALTGSMFAGTMMIGYFTGMGDFVSCSVFLFLLFPSNVIFFTFLMISIDKLIAITFPLRYRQIMKPRVVLGIIIAKWILAIVLHIHYLFSSADSFTKVAEFGNCHLNDRYPVLMIRSLPLFLASLFTAIINIYLTIKAYQIHKKIQEESELSGGHSRDNEQLKALKKKQASVKKHLKPMITLLVVVLGTSSIGLLYPLLYIPVVFLESPTVYEEFIFYVVTRNLGYLLLLFHPFVYGLYFKQIREPMMRLLKRITSLCKCNSAAVAPEPQRRINWLNPN